MKLFVSRIPFQSVFGSGLVSCFPFLRSSFSIDEVTNFSCLGKDVGKLPGHTPCYVMKRDELPRRHLHHNEKCS